ncbi:tetratricopeptide repeat-containing sulfotransferase family protein [Colwellia sp. RE-S-Sl-9]
MTIERAEHYLKIQDFSSAEQMYKRLLKENINNIEAMWGLGKVALAQNSYQRAYDLFVRCLHINAKIPDVYLSLAQACSALTRFDKTEQALLSAYQLSSHSIKVLYALSVYYCESGNLDKSEQFLNQILTIDQENIPAFSLLVRIKKIGAGSPFNPLITQYENLLREGDLLVHDKVLLNYSFGDLFHLSKKYTQAFYHYKEANRLQKQLINFSVSDMKPSIDLLLKAFTSSVIQSFSNISPASTVLTSHINITPIFIVGQPRSGSTLLEQMLIGHNDIVSAGEIPHIGDDLVNAITQVTSEGFPLGCQSLTKEQCLSLALHYLTKLKEISGGDHKFVIDKMPANYQFIGLIKLLLPQAKIIHIKRDPRDVSWSIFKNNFGALEPNFCSQTEIGQYHQLYQKVMLHWKSVLPKEVYDIEYEDLVNSPENEITQVLAYCGLAFEKDCLNFSSKKRVIKTLSDTQLRKGIQKRSIPDWTPYEHELKAMFDLLDQK